MEFPSPAGIPTLFGVVREKNVTFCIDTSGSMYQLIDAVKDHLIEVLRDRAHNKQGTMFNIIEFNTEVTQWSDRLVKCKPQTVAIAEEWIKNLSAKTGTNTKEALLLALADQSCESVYLVTDGLPDCNTNELLDHVHYASKGRPVHCIYLTSSTSSDEATHYLEDMAMETYGSFHIVSITNNGAIEKVTPIYRSDHANERVIRTTDGSIYPNIKTCSVSATVNTPEVVIPPTVFLGNGSFAIPPTVTAPVITPSVYMGGDGSNIIFPVPKYFNHYRHLWPFESWPGYSPYWWSRYRPTKAWLQGQKEIETADNISMYAPGAGALLIGNDVLARRKENGYYYRGTVKSEIMSHKFLVEFGPCKHGRFTDTVYQETFNHDIISYKDAQRHAIVVGDKVLAPWTHQGEKFGPGVVLEGVEKRYTDGTCEDKELTVNFFNGKTEKVPLNVAVWVPDALHERIKFELQLPAKVRNEMTEDDEYPEYPEENKPGYPTSGSIRNPVEYEHAKPVMVNGHHGEPVLNYDRAPYYHPDYVPIYPIVHKYTPKKPSFVQGSDMDRLIPGTEMTKDELNEKVMSQIMDHKLMLQSNRESSGGSEKLLSRRSRMTPRSSLRRTKSVEFDLDKNQSHSDLETEFDDDIDLDVEYLDDPVDSGIGTSDYSLDYNHEFQSYQPDPRDVPRERHHRRTRSGKSQRKPRWKYWSSDPSPDIIGPPTHEPYEESRTPVPLENREPLYNENGVEWTTPAFDTVDQLGGSTYDRGINEYLLRHPQPPSQPRRQGPGVEVGIGLGRRQIAEEQRQQMIRNNKLLKSIDRQQAIVDRNNQSERMKQYFEDGHQSRIRAQLSRDQDRHANHMAQVQNTREAKRLIASEIRGHFERKTEFEQGRDSRKFEALRAKGEMRDSLVQERNIERENIQQARQVTKEQRSQIRSDQHTQRLNQEEAQNAAIDRQHQRAKVNRNRHFRQLESQGQKYKDDRLEVTDKHLALFRSTVLP
ncbi:unnamed protein product [Owenia fusiformis]|uniref:Uncharacterized protein n=1 Tax=Owenia fusiformis TaxID=6347 RepID=A0A8J1TC11_OWEFU|nr:unnamed protein product [Owenia fusiformis]